MQLARSYNLATCNLQVAGYFETFPTGSASMNFTFLTVKGAGHMVPKDRPRHALDMLRRFLAGGGCE